MQAVSGSQHLCVLTRGVHGSNEEQGDRGTWFVPVIAERENRLETVDTRSSSPPFSSSDAMAAPAISQSLLLREVREQCPVSHENEW